MNTDRVQSEVLEVAIIGAGFGGMGLAIKLQQAGRSDFQIFERAADVGGVWRDNIYPGAACDVPSHLYSFSFEPNPHWQRSFGGQAEIYHYLQKCAEKHHLREKIRFNTEVSGLVFDENLCVWTVHFAGGEVIVARAVVLAIGGLNVPAYPKIEGLDSFKGKVMHTAEWDADYDLSDKRVGVIGTGASAIQVVPSIVPGVRELKLFQRTAPWVLPKGDVAISARWQKRFEQFPFLQKIRRLMQYWKFESLAPVMIKNNWMTRFAEKLGRHYINRMVKDPVLREKVTPDYALGCKRVLLSDDYYPALRQSHVDVLTQGIERIEDDGIVMRDGTKTELDVLVLATGFKVPVAGSPLNIIGIGGRSLDEESRGGREAYLGMTVSGYPNLLDIMGPNTGPGNISVIFYIESQLRYIMSYLDQLKSRNIAMLDLKKEAQRDFNIGIQKKMQKTTWTSGCDSWYLTPEGKNTTLWPGYSWQYRMQSRKFDLSIYNSRPSQAASLELVTDQSSESTQLVSS